MKIAIVGFSGCGKSTCFKAITEKKKSETENLDPTKPHLGAVKVADPRLEKLKILFNPKKLTYAEIIFEDLPGFHIPNIKDAEAMIEVLGVFSGRDPGKDIDDMDMEFMLADSEAIAKRLSSLEKELKQEKLKEKLLEKDVLLKCRDTLLKNAALRSVRLADEEEKGIRGFQFLSRKPIFILGNISEGDSDGEEVKRMENHAKEKGIRCIEFPGELEAEIVDLDESERAAFLGEMGIKETARELAIKTAYETVGYITFFTVKGNETKAWPVKDGVIAHEAAGKIHTDIEKGFIKAEVINFDELIKSGSVQEARKKGLLRLEGKEYKVKDGDIIDFRFSV